VIALISSKLNIVRFIKNVRRQLLVLGTIFFMAEKQPPLLQFLFTTKKCWWIANISRNRYIQSANIQVLLVFNIKLYWFSLDCDVAFVNVRWLTTHVPRNFGKITTFWLLLLPNSPPPLLQILDILSLLYRNGQSGQRFFIASQYF
jgi:hypothetical protein